jgi:serine/threonine-protein kinase HipA
MIGGKPNIVTERYDRRRSQGGRTLPLTRSGGTVVRLHQEDMCQALGVHPAKKYQAEKGPNIRAIMNLLSGSGNPAADRARFMRACAFNFVILGTDAHAKNFSLLIEHGNYRLAPLYDINSVLPYDRLDSRKLAMSIGAEYRWRHIGWRNWQKQAETCQFPVDAMRTEFRTLLDRAPEAAAEMLRQCQKDGLKTPILPQLARRIESRCPQLARAFGI